MIQPGQTSVLDGETGMKTDLRRGLSLLVFFIENAVENLFKFLPVGEQHIKFLQVLGVVAPRYPDFQITLWPVLLVEVSLSDESSWR